VIYLWLNRQRQAHVSASLQQVLSAALEIAQWSQGLVVPSLGQHIADIGYDRNFATGSTPWLLISLM
jgi:hypothetical protein